ncbi:MAG TPA: hypothetical protein VFJ64_11365 [Solirubrobacterales bacterium]|nr:hypothetical protein [Solirubrobacterales bacterium]
MIWRGIRPFAALLAVVLAAAPLGACGGSGSDTTASENSTATATAPAEHSGTGASSTGPGGGSSQAKAKEGGKSSGESSSSVETAPLKVSGGGSAQYRVKSGDNSIQNFGEESGESELEEAATSLHDFLVARAGEDWVTACAHLSKTVGRQLEQLASRSSKLSGAGCAEILATLTPPLPAKVQKESTIVDAGSLRTEGEQAFLIYRGAEGAVYTIPMKPEGGAWKVGALAATPLS